MARAQDGDRQAYRILLEDATPFLRALAGRCFKETADVEDVVQDVLLTVHAVRQTYDPRRPFGPWWSPSRTGGSSTDCDARCGRGRVKRN